VRSVAHCDFTPVEFSTAFFDLVNWVESGVKPEGDDWLDPAAVAADDFGCKFNDDGGTVSLKSLVHKSQARGNKKNPASAGFFIGSTTSG
jgi:hypothetical protein